MPNMGPAEITFIVTTAVAAIIILAVVAVLILLIVKSIKASNAPPTGRSPAAQNFCARCGKALPPNATFCSGCGTPLGQR